MNPRLLLPLVFAAVLLAVPALAQTNSPTITNDEAVANAYLQIQAQLHAAQMAIEDIRAADADAAKQNADAFAARLQSLEQSVTAQHNADAESARKTQQLTLLVAGGFGLACLGFMALMFYFQWRAFTKITEISAHQSAALANAGAVHQLAAPGRAVVATSNARLLDVVEQLERKIIDLENGSHLLVEAAGTKPLDLLVEGQVLLDAGQPHKALEFFDRLLAAHPDHAETLVRKSAALEKLGRLPAALEACDRAIARDDTFTPAFLQKGGLLNKLNRHDEALNCFEQVLLVQKQKAKFS